MKVVLKRTVSLMIAIVMILSLIAMSGRRMHAAGVDSSTLPEELRAVAPQYITRYDADDFDLDAGGEIVNDTDSPMGRAFYASGLKLGSWVDVYRYASSASDVDLQYLHLLEIPTPVCALARNDNIA